ncbi:VWA domain-containing protein, partial [Prosthecochloris marina]|uniref:VWA domain-containing protein n=1 Tax=Prosthecochloris marina TaxID=2017681 RepID=UPI0011B20994
AGNDTVLDSIGITVTDTDGDTSNDTFDIEIVDDVPSATGNTVVGYVEEEALEGGNQDSNDVAGINGDGDGNNAVWQGSLSDLFLVGADQPGVYGVNTDTDDLPDDLSSAGVAVKYDVADNMLTAYADEDGNGIFNAGDREVFTLEVDETTGAYTFTLMDQLDHHDVSSADDIEMSLDIDLSSAVVVQDGDGDEARLDGGSLVITVQDDIPASNTLDETFAAKPIDTNLVIVIDVSGSMGNTVNGKTRLEIAQEAVKNLIDEYDKIGDVKVQIITFSSGAGLQTYNGDVWLDPDEAEIVIDGLSANGGTNYDAALQEAMDAYGESGKLSNPQAQNVLYFMSDGNPTVPSWTAYYSDVQHGGGAGNTTEREDGIQLDEQAQWEAFLRVEKIDALAIGVGSGVSTGDLEPIAYNGKEGKDRDAVVVQNENDLSDILLSTVDPDSISGNLVKGYGSDEAGYVKSITIDGRTYSYDPDGSGGNGSISVSGGTDQSTFNTLTKILTISTSNDGMLAVNMDTGEYVYSSPTTVVTAIYTENIAYQITDSDGDVQSATGTIIVQPPPIIGTDGNDTLNGGPYSDYIKGRDGNDTIYGNDGNDMLIGGDGTDILWGGEGDDILVFDTADTIDGGAGTDTLFVKAGESVDFTSYVSQLSNLEIIQLDIGAKVLGLSQSDVSGITGGSMLKIIGNETSGVELDGSWTVGSQIFEDGVTFNVYTSGSTTVKVQDGVYLLTIDSNSGSTVQGINSGSEDDWLIGNNGNDILNGGAGDDLLEGGAGNDSLYGGAGDDILLYDAADSIIDGGDDVDILRLDNGDDLDFSGTTLSSKITDIEVIDMSSASGEYGSSGNDYLLDDNEIENLSARDVIDITDGDNTLYILRGIADIVELEGFTLSASDQNVTLNGETYVMDQYTGVYGGVQATVYIQDGYQYPEV